MSVTNPTPQDHIRWICNTSIDDGRNSIRSLLANREKHGDAAVLAILESALEYEKQHSPRKSLITALDSAIWKCRDAITHKSVEILTTRKSMSSKSTTPVVTKDQPKDPRWDQAREVASQLQLCGRLYLRGQVKLGMILSALKKEFGISKGKRPSTSPDSGEVLSWPDLVKRETGYSRQSCDEFIRLYEATKAKLKTSKKLKLPAPVKKDAIVLFKAENPLTLTDAQWEQVDQVISSLTTGETQISLMQELGIVPKPKPMPKGTKDGKDNDDEITAGQLAFHFFDAVAAPLINARTNPDYKKMLLCLPIESDADHPLSLSTLEAEARALLADIAEVKEKTAKPAKGRTLNV